MPSPPQAPEVKVKTLALVWSQALPLVGWVTLDNFLASLYLNLPICTVGLMLCIFNEISQQKLFQQWQTHGKTLKKCQTSFCFHYSCYYLTLFAHSSHTHWFICWHFWWSCTCLCFYAWCSFCLEVPISHQFIHSYAFSHSFNRVFAELPTTPPVDSSQSPPWLFPLDWLPILKVYLLSCYSVNSRAEKNALFPRVLLLWIRFLISELAPSRSLINFVELIHECFLSPKSVPSA